jgi:transposase
VLLKSEGWTNKAIAQALRIHADRVADHLRIWAKEKRLELENGGSVGKLSEQRASALDAHVYVKVIDLCRFVSTTWDLSYSVSGMTKWLREHGFRYKKPKATRVKADPEKQEEWVKGYQALVDETPADELIVFMGAAHPTVAIKIVCGWLKQGIDKPIAQTASRTRVNVLAPWRKARETKGPRRRFFQHSAHHHRLSGFSLLSLAAGHLALLYSADS